MGWTAAVLDKLGARDSRVEAPGGQLPYALPGGVRFQESSQQLIPSVLPLHQPLLVISAATRLQKLPVCGALMSGIVWSVSEQLDLTIVYEPGEEGWVIASIPEVAGVFSQGRTREEARANVIDALRLMLSPEPGDADDRREREALHLTIAA